MIQLFVTGTDTGVGKTTIACALLAAARARGLRVQAMKPVETGCLSVDGTPGALAAADGIALAHAAGNSDDGARSTLYRFAAPLAPAVAAADAGHTISLAPLLREADRLRSLGPDLLVIEGAGGLLVPLTETLDMASLAGALKTPLLVVARNGLGTINHTLLTLEAAASRGLSVLGVVLNAADEGTSQHDAKRNGEEIARRGRVPVLGQMPRFEKAGLKALASAAEENLKLSILLG